MASIFARRRERATFVQLTVSFPYAFNVVLKKCDSCNRLSALSFTYLLQLSRLSVFVVIIFKMKNNFFFLT